MRLKVAVVVKPIAVLHLTVDWTVVLLMLITPTATMTISCLEEM